MSHVQRAAQDSRRDEVGDPHSTAEGKYVDVGDVGQRRLQEHKCAPVTGIGRRDSRKIQRNFYIRNTLPKCWCRNTLLKCYIRHTLKDCYRTNTLWKFAVGTFYRIVTEGTLYRLIAAGPLYVIVTLRTLYRIITLGTIYRNFL